MSLDIKKMYVDNHFRASSSNSEIDFSIELPRSFNGPDGVVAHIDDIAIPACWTTVDERNPNCYLTVFAGVDLKIIVLQCPQRTTMVLSLQRL